MKNQPMYSLYGYDVVIDNKLYLGEHLYLIGDTVYEMFDDGTLQEYGKCQYIRLKPIDYSSIVNFDDVGNIVVDNDKLVWRSIMK